jgi:hypothetical protein
VCNWLDWFHGMRTRQQTIRLRVVNTAEYALLLKAGGTECHKGMLCRRPVLTGC